MRNTNQHSIRKVAGGMIAMLSVMVTLMAVIHSARAQVMSGDKYSITSSVVGSGGGSSSAGNMKIEGTAGQSAAGGPYTGASVSHVAGFWSASLASAATPTPTPSPTPSPAFGLAINDVSQVEGTNGTTTFSFVVTLSKASDQTVTVNYATVDGTANSSDYQFASGLLTFNPGELSKPVNVLVNGDTQIEPHETFFVNLSNAVNATITRGQGLGTILNDDAASPTTTFQFAQPTYSVQEDLGVITVTVIRTGDTSVQSTVDYKTVDGGGAQKADFEYAAGTLTFAPGETGKTFQLLINEDMYAEGPENFSVTLSNPTGAVLGGQSTATVNITDDSPESVVNPVDDPQQFVYTHYHDFLNREPDPAGLAFWTNQITSCGNDAGCIEARRINVSASFFLSIEFQETAYLLYLMQKESYSNMPKYASFMRDLQEVSRGLIVNNPGWQQKLTGNQQQFADQWVSRPEFKAVYDALSNDAYVNALYKNAGIVPPQAEKDALVAALNGASLSRSAVLLEVANNTSFRQQEQT